MTHEMTAAEGAQLVGANSQFALDLYRYITATTSGNVFMSPLNISTALAMTYLGARNKTKIQMSNVMHLREISDDCVHQWFSYVRRGLIERGPPLHLFTASRLFAEKSCRFVEDYLLTIKAYYGAKLEPVDFR
jgi:serpin B